MTFWCLHGPAGRQVEGRQRPAASASANTRSPGRYLRGASVPRYRVRLRRLRQASPGSSGPALNTLVTPRPCPSSTMPCRIPAAAASTSPPPAPRARCRCRTWPAQSPLPLPARLPDRLRPSRIDVSGLVRGPRRQPGELLRRAGQRTPPAACATGASLPSSRTCLIVTENVTGTAVASGARRVNVARTASRSSPRSASGTTDQPRSRPRPGAHRRHAS